MPYATRTDLEAVYGRENVETWADLENNDVEADVTARVAAALAFAEADVNNRLRGGPYVIPLTLPVETIIVDLTAKIAGVWLYESRGIHDTNSETGVPQHKLMSHRNAATRTISELLSGRQRLAIVGVAAVFAGAPEVIVDGS